MTNVLYLITELDVGGAERTLFDLATHLDRAKFTPHVACLMGRGEIGRMLEGAGVPVHYLDMKGKWDIRALFRVRRLLCEKDIHILHTFLFHANMAGRIAARLAGTPVRISSVHLLETRRLRLFAESVTSGLVDRVVCVSRTVQEHTRTKGRISAEKLALIPNGVDMARFEVPKRELVRVSVREELNIPLEAPVVTTVTRFHPEKGIDDLLQTIRLIISGEPAAHVIVVGEGRLRADVEQAVFAMDGSERVHLAGLRQDVPRILASSDVFICTSPKEGLGLAVLEAMAAGVPVAAFDVSGVREAVGENGVLVTAGNCLELASAAVRLLHEPETARALAERAIRHVGEKFSLERMVAKTEALYETLLCEKIV
jgi:glycosyltransferase involved in cell wall biosynthesis